MQAQSPVKISIIIAVFNMKDTLANAIESVLEQSYSHWELLILDGGSTDGTVDVIKHYAEHLVFWESKKDKGHIDACNKALPHTSGELICLLNADDILLPQSLQKVADAFMQNSQCQIISGGAIIKKLQDGIAVTTKQYACKKDLELTLENILFKMPLINSRFFHKDIFKHYGNFCETNYAGNYYISNDREFLSRLAILKVPSVIIPEPLYQYYAHPFSLTFSNKHSLQIHLEHRALAINLLNNPLLSSNDFALVKKWKAKETILSIFYLLKNKKIITACQIFFSEVKNNLLQLVTQFYQLFVRQIFKRRLRRVD